MIYAPNGSLNIANPTPPRLPKPMTPLETFIVENWTTPATAYVDAQVGNVRIHKCLCSSDYYYMSGINGYIFFRAPKPLYMTELQVKQGQDWRMSMVDDPPNWFSMAAFAAAAHGHVLTAGLGLGLVLHELIKNPDVCTVTVYEQDQDVLNLVVPLISNPRDKPVNYVKGDFLQEAMEPVNYYDTIIADIWVTTGREEKEAIIPAAFDLATRIRLSRPGIRFDLHGFVTLSDTQVVPQETQDLILSIASLDSVAYGLSLPKLKKDTLE